MAALVAALGGSQFTSRSASALIDYCRTDPIVHLSDGTHLQMRTQIEDGARDVQSVVYTIHAPRGVAIRHVVYTGAGLSGKESVKLVDDSTTGYSTDTLVTTHVNTAGVTTETFLPGIGSGVTRGLSGQILLVQIGA